MTGTTITRQPFDAFERLKRLSHTRLGPQALFIMEAAFDAGGYVAGGFARVLLRELLEMEGTHSRNGDQGSNIATYLKSGDKIERDYPHWKVGRGDIDLFFPDDIALTQFYKLIWDDLSPLSDVKTFSSPTESAQECDCDGNVSVQIITKYLAPIEDQLKSFDIQNAMIAFNDKEVLVADGWMRLEKERMLHVCNWTSPFIINRLAKWVNKHGLRRLSPETAKQLGQQALKIMEHLKKNPIDTPWNVPYTHERVKALFKQFLPWCSDEDLLLLMTVYPVDAYQGAFDVLRKRTLSPAV